MVLKISKKHRKTPLPVKLPQPETIKKETQAQVFSCEFYGRFKDTFFTEYLQTTASVV